MSILRQEHCYHCLYSFTPYVIFFLNILLKAFCVLINNKLQQVIYNINFSAIIYFLEILVCFFLV